jgi:Homeodomain
VKGSSSPQILNKMDQLRIAAADGAKRMPRLRFSSEASERLMAIYQSGISKPNKQLREELAKDLNKTPRSIQIWFQNRRAKAKVSALKGEFFPGEENEDLNSPKANLSKLNMNAVESLASPQSAKFLHSPLRSPYSGPKSAYAFSARHDPYSYSASPKQRLPESPNNYQQQKGFSPYPSPLDSNSPHSRNFQSQYLEIPVQQQQHYSRFDKPVVKLEMNKLSNSGYDNVPHSAFEMRAPGGSFPFSDSPASSYLSKMPGLSIKDDDGDKYVTPHSAMPYSTNAFNFPNIPDSSPYNAPEPTESSGYKLPNLNEIADDPAKFMQWIGTSR